jgi:D-inositol-3-phosphate glycosyltransferase
MTTFGMRCPSPLYFADFGRGRTTDIASDAPVQGANVALNSFLRAFLRHGQVDQYWFFAPPSSVDRINKAIKEEAGRSRMPRGIGVRSFSSLADKDKFRAYGFTHWLDLSCSFEAPSSLRRRFSSRPFPIIVTHHTISYPWMLRKLFMPMVLSKSYPFDAVVCTSTAARTAILRILDHLSIELKREQGIEAKFRGRLEVIPLGVDTDKFRPRQKETARREIGLPRNAFIILYFGRLSPVDKADLIPFIRVFRDLVKSNPRKKLLFVVSSARAGPYLDTLIRCVRESGIGKNVRFIVTPENPALLYSAADIFVSPVDNIQESFGLSVIEAMACGIPQVVSDWNGYRDTVVDGETGFLVPTHWMQCDGDLCEAAPLFEGDGAFDHVSLAQSVAIDLRAYRDRLQGLIDNAELRGAMSHHSRQRAVSCFSWPSVMQRYRTLWTELGTMAAAAKRVSNSSASSSHPRYFDAFGHYASHEVTAATRLRITAAGRRARPAASPEYEIAEEWKLLDQHLLLDTLSLLRRQELNRETLVDRLASIPRHKAHHRHLIYRHVMWLLKHGLIEICD